MKAHAKFSAPIRALQVEWLRERIQRVPVRLVFESALELMGTTQLGSFKACAATSWSFIFRVRVRVRLRVQGSKLLVAAVAGALAQHSAARQR